MVEDASLAPLLQSARAGLPGAAQSLYAALYNELRRMAQRELRRSGGGLTLSANTLLHETFLKVARRDNIAFPDRAHFMGYAARAMRGVIVDYARARRAQKRGGEFEITRLPTDIGEFAAQDTIDADLLTRLSSAVDRLEQVDAALAELVDLKYFAGFSFTEIASMRGVAERTIYRHWEKARIFLFDAIGADEGGARLEL